MRGGGNDETVSTGCGPPSVLHPWMLLLHMQETVLWIHRPGLLSSRGGGPDILDVTVTYARDSFVDSPAGPFVLSRGGPDILAPGLQTHMPAVLACHHLALTRTSPHT